MDHHGMGDNVISLATRQPMTPEAMRVLEAYWLALADGRIMPNRAEIDPRGLDATLDRTFLIERIASGHARFRVAGSRLAQLLEMDLRGLPFSALFHPTARPDLADALRALFDEPARIGLRLTGSGSVMTGRLQAECLMLPLRDDDGRVTRAIGCIDWSRKVSGRQRFRITDQARRTLIGYAHRPMTDPAPPGPTVPDRHETGAADRPPRGRPILTLVD